MATILKLVEKGVLVRIEVELEGVQPWRRLFGTPDFISWLDDDLPKLTSSAIGCETTPLEQVDALFASFVDGSPLNIGRQFKRLLPSKKAVWEFKTIDIRIFGWFAMKDDFIAVFGNHADKVKDHDLYAGYRDEVLRIRTELDLDEPKFVDGEETDDVVSTAAKPKR